MVTAVNGVATPSAQALDLRTLPPPLGTDRHPHGASKGAERAPRPATGHAASPRWSTWAAVRQVRLDLGIQPEDQVDFTYPFPVKIDVTNIGGPSAGLAMTLGVIDALSQRLGSPGDTPWRRPGPSTARATWATWAAWPRRRWRSRTPVPRSSSCPRQEYKAAMSKVRPGLQVYAVSTLDQALQVLAAARGAGTSRAGGTSRSAPRSRPRDDGFRVRTVVGSRPCPRSDCCPSRPHPI